MNTTFIYIVITNYTEIYCLEKTHIINSMKNTKLRTTFRRNGYVINILTMQISDLKIQYKKVNLAGKLKVTQQKKLIMHKSTLAPDSFSSSSIEPITLFSMPSSLIQTGRGVPQNLLRLTAQSLAFSSQL